MPTATLRPHDLNYMSHSKYTGMLWCSKQYELGRLAGAPALPAWWFIGGSTVHEVTEAYDRLALSKSGVRFDFERETRAKLDELVEKELREKNLTGFDSWL